MLSSIEAFSILLDSGGHCISHRFPHHVGRVHPPIASGVGIPQGILIQQFQPDQEQPLTSAPFFHLGILSATPHHVSCPRPYIAHRVQSFDHDALSQSKPVPPLSACKLHMSLPFKSDGTLPKMTRNPPCHEKIRYLNNRRSKKASRHRKPKTRQEKPVKRNGSA